LIYKIGLVFLLVFHSLAPVDASQKVVLGGKCKSVNKSVLVGNTTYICVKKQGKLVWSKEKNNDKKTVPSPLKTPTGFNDLIDNYQGIHLAAWNSAYEKLKSTNSLELELNVQYGPKTTPPHPNINEMFVRGSKLFSGFRQPTKINALYYGFDDVKWAQDKINELYGNHSVKQWIPRNCENYSRCGGANASLIMPYVGHANFGASPMNKGAYHTKGGIEIHEYAHTVQQIQFQDKPTFSQQPSLFPVWFIEGHAHFIGNAGSANSLTEYRDFRKQWKSQIPVGLNNYSVESIEQFYEKLSAGKNDDSIFGNVYTIGYFTVEALVAIKGVDSPMGLVSLVSSGKSFDEAFISIYGYSWNEASKILAKSVSRMFLEKDF
jgi:hypothetical protein